MLFFGKRQAGDFGACKKIRSPCTPTKGNLFDPLAGFLMLKEPERPKRRDPDRLTPIRVADINRIIGARSMSGLVDTTTHNENHLDCFFNPTSFGWVEKQSR